MNQTLLDPSKTAFRLELTAAQLKLTHTALRSLLLDFGHDEYDLASIVREVLAKLPSDAEIRAIDIPAELARRRSLAVARGARSG